MSYQGLKRWKSDTHAHTRARAHTYPDASWKSNFFDVLDYSEYSDTNISKNFFFSRKHSFLSQEAKWKIYKSIQNPFSQKGEKWTPST